MDGLAEEGLTGDQAAAPPVMKQPGAIPRAGPLTPAGQLVDGRELPAVKVGAYLLDCQRLSGKGTRVCTQKNTGIYIFCVRFLP